jgi:hypothetical protein
VSKHFPPLDPAAEQAAIATVNNQFVPALAKFAGPDAGCYINEVSLAHLPLWLRRGGKLTTVPNRPTRMILT